jgi:hypothetical protein
MPQFGENFVAGLLRSLPPERYIWFVHPQISPCTPQIGSPTFVILSPDFGALVVEVRSWTAITRVTPSGVQIQHADGSSSTEVNPLLIAREYAHCLRAVFLERYAAIYGVSDQLENSFPVGYAAALPNIAQTIVLHFAEKGAWEKGRVWSNHDINAFRFERTLQSTPLSPPLPIPPGVSGLDVMRGVLDSSLIIRDTSGQDIGTLTPEQARLIEEPVRRIRLSEKPAKKLEIVPDEVVEAADNFSVRLVRGVAGSGKSIVLVKRALHLAETEPDKSFIIMAYNPALVEDLRQRLAEQANLRVLSFESLCAAVLGDDWCPPFNVQEWLERHPAAVRLMQQHGFTAEFVAEEIEWRKEMNIFNPEKYLIVEREGRIRALNRGKRGVINTLFDQYMTASKQSGWMDHPDITHLAFERLTHRHPLFHSCDAILIDEAQDFAPSWIALVKRLIKPGGTLFLCDDPTQSLFRAFSWRRRGVDVVGHTRTLRIPFRNTREIARAAFSLVYADPGLSKSNDIPKPDLESTFLRSGNLPVLVNCQDAMREARAIERYIQQLRDEGVFPGDIAILCHRSWMNRRWSQWQSKGIHVKSFAEVKGLEYEAVIIPQIHSLFEHELSQKDDTFISEMRRRIFTAMTRARETLILTYVEVMPTELNPLLPHVRTEMTRVRQ